MHDPILLASVTKMVMLGYLNVSLTFVCLWLRRIYGRLNRLPKRVVGTMHDGAVTSYEDD